MMQREERAEELENEIAQIDAMINNNVEDVKVIE